MPFNLLLANYLHHGTSFNERGVPVSIKPNSDETFLFFNIDSNKNKKQFNEYLGIADEGEKICDLLIYHFNHASSEPKKAICLVELKGGKDFPHAVEQLLNTHKIFSKLVANTKQFQDAKWGAFIMTKPKISVPHNTKQFMKPLKDKGLMCYIGKKDIESFIRKLV